MATEEKTKKKGKGFVSKMMFGDTDKPDLTPEQLNMSKWAMFKYLFFGRFGTMVALNMLTLLFAVPGILVGLLFYLNSAVSNGFLPYSANLAIGYPVVTDVVAQGLNVKFTYTLYGYLSMVPCIAVFMLGVVGNMYVLRKLIWEQPTSTVKDFFRGIGKCWLPAVIVGFALGFTILLFKFSIGFFDVYTAPKALKALAIIGATVLLVFMVMFTAFLLTQNAAFAMRPMVLIRNSLLFILGTNFQGMFFIALAVAPTMLFLIPGATLLISLLFAFFGISYVTLVTSLYCHYCYQRFLYDKIDGKPNSMYAKRGNDISEQKPEAQKKRQPVPYKNPKKRKKSIDEGSTITPLAPTFRREDLERLAKEHEKVLEESADELGELDEDDELEDIDTAAENAVAEDTAAENAAENAAEDAVEPTGETDEA